VAAELGHHFSGAVGVLVGGDRREEITRVRKPVGADRAQLRQSKCRAVVLAGVAARHFSRQRHAKANAAGNHRDLARRNLEPPEFGGEVQCTLLRNDQQLAVGIVEHTLHGAIRVIAMHAHAGLRMHVSTSGVGRQPVDEIHGAPGRRQRRPSQAIGRALGFAARRRSQQAVVDAGKRTVHRRGVQAVEPAAQVLGARRGEGRARKLLGVQAERNLLRRVLAKGQRARHCLAFVMRSEPRQILEPIHLCSSVFIRADQPR
jgi:hypothetical protein